MSIKVNRDVLKMKPRQYYEQNQDFITIELVESLTHLVHSKDNEYDRYYCLLTHGYEIRIRKDTYKRLIVQW